MDNLYQDYSEGFEDPSGSSHEVALHDVDPLGDSSEGFSVRMAPSKHRTHSRPFLSSILPKSETEPKEKYCKKAKTVPCPICNYQFSRSRNVVQNGRTGQNSKTIL